MNEQSLTPLSQDYQRIEQAIRYLEQNFRRQPSLAEIAASVHLSPFHFQRLFKRWAGISPSQFMQFLTVEYAKGRLAEAESVLNTSLDAGLSGPGRLHDLFVTFAAMTPGEYKQQGAEQTIRYGWHQTPFGDCLLARTDRGICALRFGDPSSHPELLAELQVEWSRADFIADTPTTAPLAARIFSNHSWDSQRPFHLHLRGTNFQIQVWQALLAIPMGAMVAYNDLANKMGKPNATRAVASAIGRNPVGFLIPCHRVISKVGKAHQYRWGSARKKALIGWEAARFATAVSPG